MSIPFSSLPRYRRRHDAGKSTLGTSSTDILRELVQIGDILAQITGEPSPTATTHTIPPPSQRKSVEQLRKPVDKIQRSEPQPRSLSKPTTQVPNPPAVNASMAKMKLGQSGRPFLQSPTTTFKNGQPTPPPQSEPAKPPKKGSYAEIMARGKAAQATLGQVGKIQHKKIEKLPSKREREELKATKAHNLQKNLGPDGKFRTAGQQLLKGGRSGSKEGERKISNGKVGTGKKSKEAVEDKKVKKAAVATTGYTGTARPKPNTNGPSRSSNSSSSRYNRGPDRYRNDRYSSSSKRQSYLSEDEEEEEDEEDYASDVSSDMEAAAFEVDEEEEEAARIARREDAEALAEENRHKREKEEKRRRLAAMAKARR
jgi:protein SPT2